MGGREHSVVVDSDSWTTDSGRNKSDSHLCGHTAEDTVKARQQEGRGLQV